MINRFFDVKVYYSKLKKSPKLIASELNIPISTVYRYISLIKKKKVPNMTKKSGRRPKLDGENRKRLLNIALKNDQFSIRQVTQRFKDLTNLSIGKSTTARYLKKNNISKKAPYYKPNLTEEHMKKRVEWCLKHRDTDWSKVFFTDESFFLINRYKSKYWAKKNSRKVVKKSRPSGLMVWGGISSRGLTSLKIDTRKINSEKYCSILEECFFEDAIILFPDRDFILMQDNARPHTSKFTKLFLQKSGIIVLDWPANSPDLNPIENLWAIMKKRFELHKVKTKEEMKIIIQKVWDEISPTLVENLINSMPARIEQCIQNNGDKIKN